MTQQNSATADEIVARSPLEFALIRHAQFESAVEAVFRLLARSRHETDGRRLKPRGLLLLGAAGAGKTTVVEYVEETHQAVRGPEGMTIPVLIVEVPAKPTKRALVSAILGKMGYNSPRSVNSFDIIAEIVRKADLLGVQLIILDEAHHILHSRDEQDVSEFLKSLLNQAGPSIVFAGLPELTSLRLSPQFERRLEPDILLRPYDWTSRSERSEFLALLHRIETSHLRLEKPSGLADQDVARRLYAATRG